MYFNNWISLFEFLRIVGICILGLVSLLIKILIGLVIYEWEVVIGFFIIGFLWILGIMWNLVGLLKWLKLCKKWVMLEERNLL